MDKIMPNFQGLIFDYRNNGWMVVSFCNNENTNTTLITKRILWLPIEAHLTLGFLSWQITKKKHLKLDIDNDLKSFSWFFTQEMEIWERGKSIETLIQNRKWTMKKCLEQ